MGGAMMELLITALTIFLSVFIVRIISDKILRKYYLKTYAKRMFNIRKKYNEEVKQIKNRYDLLREDIDKF
jgi:hypothetical protein